MLLDIQTKLIMAAIAAFALIAGCSASYLYGHHKGYGVGKSEVQAAWTAENLRVSQADLKAQIKATADNKLIADKHDTDILQARTENKNEIDAINALHAATVKRLSVNAGKGHCVPALATTGETKDTLGGDAPPTGTFVFSEETARDLRQLVMEADLTVASCRALQSLVIKEGLYVQP